MLDIGWEGIGTGGGWDGEERREGAGGGGRTRLRTERDAVVLAGHRGYVMQPVVSDCPTCTPLFTRLVGQNES